MNNDNKKNEIELFINKIEELSEGKILEKEDINRIIELSIENDRLDLLEQLSFQAKYISGLIKIIQGRKEDIEEVYFHTLSEELTEGISKVRDFLDRILDYASEFIKNIFHEKFFAMSQHSLNNLKILCEDLSWVKIYLNDVKRKI